MSGGDSGPDAEFAAIQTVYTALNALDEGARARVMEYVSDRLGLTVRSRVRTAGQAAAIEEDDERDERSDLLQGPVQFSTFAELFDAAAPKTQSDKSLVGGYWLQICQGAESFDGLSINKELKNLGEGVANITSALDGLKNQKPALALQLKKSGKSRQARKTYKVTVAGIKAVEAMISGQA